MDFQETRIEGETLYEGRVFTIGRDTVALHDGKRVFREIVRHNGGVGVLALGEENGQTYVTLVRQFRYGAGMSLWEIPAGKLEPGEQPEACGRRELREEAGFEAGVFLPLGKFYATPAYCTEMIHLFAAKDLVQVGEKLDEDEWLAAKRFSWEAAMAMVTSGEIIDGKTVVALLLAKEKGLHHHR